MSCLEEAASSDMEILSTNDEFEISANLCRLCLNESNILKSMFHCSIGSKSYAEIYQEITGYRVLEESHQLPVRICNVCEENLVGFHHFLQNVEEVERRLDIFRSGTNVIEESAENLIIEETDEFLIVDNESDLSGLQEISKNPEAIKEETEMPLDPVCNEQVITGEEYEIEQVYDEDDEEDTAVDSSKSCRFIPSPDFPKNVKCLRCNECELEKIINDEKPEEPCVGLQCECRKMFKNRRSFIKHFMTVHERRKFSYKCHDCTEVFPTWRSRVVHEANVHGQGLKFRCSTCEKKFYRSDHLKEHAKICNHPKELREKFFTCEICSFTFQREESYRKHLETAHTTSGGDNFKKIESVKQDKKNRKDSSGSEKSGDVRSSCDHCGKEFKNEMSLNKHINLMHSNQLWSCDQCDAVFVHRSTGMSHAAKVHGARKSHECYYPNCSFSCFKRDRFQAHIDKHENPDKKFFCPICQQEFNSYNTMTLHRAKHLSKNTFECEFCQKKFLDKRNFNVHLKLHTRQDLFHCPVCDQGYNKKEHLKKHQERKNHFGGEVKV